jgi:hypothetical protein
MPFKLILTTGLIKPSKIEMLSAQTINDMKLYFYRKKLYPTLTTKIMGFINACRFPSDPEKIDERFMRM